MSIPRVFTGQSGLMPGVEFRLEADESKHLIKVLRLQPGDEFELVDKAGRLYLAELVHGETSQAQAVVKIELPGKSEPEIQVVLVQGLPKGDKMDFIVQKATELGVSQIVPLEVEHSVVRYSGDKAGKKVERWQKIAKEAAKQSDRLKVPEVKEISTLKDLGEQPDFWGGLHLLAWEGTERSLKNILRTRSEEISRIVIYIGPEGSFSEEEINWLLDKGVYGVSLGPRILRTETAGLTLLSIVMYAFDQLEV